YEELLTNLESDEAVLFADAVHPTHTVRPVGCWAPKETPIAVEQTRGRQRLNLHGTTDDGRWRQHDPADDRADGKVSEQAGDPSFLDNAKYHHAELVQQWLAQPGCRIKLHFIPTYCPHLDPIERLWGLMHRHITHNSCHATFRQFSEAVLTFLRDEVPRKWQTYCDQVTDKFRIISPRDFRVLA